MFQLDPASSAAALDELIADVNTPVVASAPVLVLPAFANENAPVYQGSGQLAWEDDEYFYVFED